VIRARKTEQMVRIMSQAESIEHFKQRPKELQGGTVSVALSKTKEVKRQKKKPSQKEVK
jgi:hypothetical protein